VVALTLPDEVVRGLKKFHPDLAWAIVTLFENGRTSPNGERQPDAELVGIADRRFLIVVNRAVFKRLPGIQIIPLSGNRAFLALEPGRGMADLELAVLDRLGDVSLSAREHAALQHLRTLLARWRRDRALNVSSRAIIVVERVAGSKHRSSQGRVRTR
jgi:hypothetical protein